MMRDDTVELNYLYAVCEFVLFLNFLFTCRSTVYSCNVQLN